ncbi:hypothetical protein [Methylobacterium sp. A54F]
MSGPASRRRFLRGLTTLPLIGGSVALIGTPSAVAEPVTKDLLIAYADWLLLERRILLRELIPDAASRARATDTCLSGSRTDAFHIPPDGDWRAVPKPSTRAALVLSAVGCDWREGSI